MTNDKQVKREVVNIPIKPKLPGYEITHDDLNRQFVVIHFYKGKVSALDIFEKGKTIMFRVRIQFTGNLAKFIPIDAIAAKETIETIDLDLELLEIFFKRKETSQAVTQMFSPMVDKYYGVQIGKHIGRLRIGYDIFTEFVAFIRYLSYSPLGEDIKL